MLDEIIRQAESIVEEAFQNPSKPGDDTYRRPLPGDVNYYAEMREYAKFAAQRTIRNSKHGILAQGFHGRGYRGAQRIRGTQNDGAIFEARIQNGIQSFIAA